MNKIFTFLTFAVLIGSCITKNNHGLPDKVVFTKDGGEITITSNQSISQWSIHKDGEFVNNDYFSIDENGEITQKYGWMTLKYKEMGFTTTVIAEPLADNKRRALNLHYTTWDYIDVGIIQVPKDSVQLGLKPKK